MQADHSFLPWEPLGTRSRPGARSILVHNRGKRKQPAPPGVILLGGDWEGSQWRTTAQGARQGGAGGECTRSSRVRGWEGGDAWRGHRRSGRQEWQEDPGSEIGTPALQLRQALRQKVVSGPEELQVPPCARVSVTSTGLKGPGEPGNTAEQEQGRGGWLPREASTQVGSEAEWELRVGRCGETTSGQRGTGPVAEKAGLCWRPGCTATAQQLEGGAAIAARTARGRTEERRRPEPVSRGRCVRRRGVSRASVPRGH